MYFDEKIEQNKKSPHVRPIILIIIKAHIKKDSSLQCSKKSFYSYYSILIGLNLTFAPTS